MVVLSFSQEHEAGVTIVRKGEIVAAINEERLTRVKNQDGFPEKSLNEALRIAQMEPEDIDIVVIPEISKFKDVLFNVISRSNFPYSLDHYYASPTKRLGFKANRHEGKILGLAAYGNPKSSAYSLIKDLLLCEGLQVKVPFMMGKMWHHRISVFKNTLMCRLIKMYPREDIAAVFQRRFEEVITELIKNCLKKISVEKCSSGWWLFCPC